jgi:hypothetical protein
MPNVHEVFASVVEPPSREPDVFRGWRRGRRLRGRRLAGGFLAACLLASALVGGVLVVNGHDSGRQTKVTARSSSWNVDRDDAHGVTISYPPGWNAATSTLTPELVNPVQAVAVGTYSLRAGTCGGIPKLVLNDLGPTDAFVSAYVYLTPPSPDLPGRPSHFTPDLNWGTNILCANAPNGSVRDLTFQENSREVWVLLALGNQVSPQRQSEAYQVLDSLVIDPRPTAGTPM